MSDSIGQGRVEEIGSVAVPYKEWGRFRRAFRRLVHVLSSQFIYEMRRTRITKVAGFRLTVPPTVFHPRWFITSEFFATFISRLDLSGLKVADVGTGTGILALSAARAGASHVTAIDINVNAVRAAIDNARANGFADRVEAVKSNLLADLPSDVRYDVILSSPPSFPGEPQSLADRAWHAGPEYRDIIPLFEQARQRLAPNGRLYLLLSSDSHPDYLTGLAQRTGLKSSLVERRSLLVEAFLIYELTN